MESSNGDFQRAITRALAAEASLAEALKVLTETRKQIAAIIDDGTPTDFKAWLADIDAALDAKP